MTDRRFGNDLGKADWIFDPDFFGDGSDVALHMAVCSATVARDGMMGHCGKGPLDDNQIPSGHCDEHGATPRAALVQPRVAGMPFRCPCGGNVFRKAGDVYTCNACGEAYFGTPP